MSFTKEEREIMDLLIEANNKFVALKSKHPQEKTEWNFSIHQLQYVLSFRILQRDYPKDFPTYEAGPKPRVCEDGN